MKISIRLAAFAVICLLFQAWSGAEEFWNVRGRVVDEHGKPVAGAAVDCFWSANGTRTDEKGRPLELSNKVHARLYWTHVGEMQPMSQHVESDGRGGFEVRVPITVHTILAMNQERSRGGLAVLPKGHETAPLEIRLGPLVRAFGSLRDPAGKTPDWGHVYALTPEDPTRPLDFCRMLSCEFNDGHFAMSLPPGRYLLEATSHEGEGLYPFPALVLSENNREVNVGTLALRKVPLGGIPRSKANGTYGRYKKYFGKKPPPWFVTDARGVPKGVQIEDFKGKWVLLDFWGLSCTVCLRETMPKLIGFYEKHHAQRDRFEILSICIDADEELKSMADLDRQLKPIVEHVWGGKTIPFPVLLDSSFKTWDSFGIPGLGAVMLVDPEGKLVEGDEETLAEKLRAKPRMVD